MSEEQVKKTLEITIPEANVLVEAINIAIKSQGVDAGVQLMQNRLIMVNKVLLLFKEEVQDMKEEAEPEEIAAKPPAKRKRRKV